MKISSQESALLELSESKPTEFLTPNKNLATAARQAAKLLFDDLAQILQNKSQGQYSGLKELHVDGFDPEQIWLQLELLHKQSDALLKKNISKILRQYEADENLEFFPISDNVSEEEGKEATGSEEPTEEDEVEEREEIESEEAIDEEIEETDEAEDGEDEGDSEEPRNKLPFEDKFFNVKDMEKFLEQAEAEDEEDLGQLPELYEAGELLDDDEEEEEDDEEDEQAEGGSQGGKEVGFSTQKQDLEASDIKYEDFFGPKKQTRAPVKRVHFEDERREEEEEEEEEAEEAEGEAAEAENLSEEKELTAETDLSKLSSHERRQLKLQQQAQELEEANLNPRNWTLQGEVLSSERPKNSALEAELDFEHASRPPPVITEEVTASLEDMIKQRIVEQQFDDVEKKQGAAVERTPRERTELDDSQSQKGLAEIYEAEYSLAAGLSSAAPSATDTLKHQSAVLFKELCLKLDALSHFSFAPKPVVEDTSIRADVPAIAMEEVAPVGVSHASLLAPEEVFSGGGGGGKEAGSGMSLGGVRGSARGEVKAEGEVTREEKKQRHRKLKRKWKKVNEAESKGEPLRSLKGKKSSVEESSGKGGVREMNYTKSSQVFAKLQDSKAEKPQRKEKKESSGLKSATLKL